MGPRLHDGARLRRISNVGIYNYTAMTAKSTFWPLLFILFVDCSKDKPSPDNPFGLPNATRVGANSFGCLVNGQKFISYYNPSGGIGAKVRGDTLGITGQPEHNDYYEFIGFQIINLIANSTHTIDGKSTYGILGTDSTCFGLSFNSTTAYASSGSIILTRFDIANKIASGTFDCIFPVPGCDTLNVTEGRFDYYY